MPGDISAGDLAKKVIEWGADGVVSLSIADENALRDAVVKRLLKTVDIAMVGHTLGATSLAANKWDTKALLDRHGFDTPPGVLVDNDVLAGRGLAIPAYVDSILLQVADIGYPVISKPLWDCMGVGMVALSDETELLAHLAQPHHGNFILEKCATGEICSVEVVGAQGHYLVQPVVWQGPAEAGPVFNFGRLRYVTPREAEDRAFAPLAEKLKRLSRQLDIEGAIGLDMIYENGIYQILEINPRVTGTTVPCVAASGVNTYDCLLSILNGTWPAGIHREPAVERVCLQFPVRELSPAFVRDVTQELDVVRTQTLTIDETEYPNMIITCELGDRDTLPARLASLQQRHEFTDPALLAQISRVVGVADVSAKGAGN
ncbi:ATP-grasp domain-containing protein [Streptomyces sp. LP05-1]|uniref:ATP-grasp domain-containing protein n=1 Tax=Streptomyces pyxinae TaxID=2970734 RepID=A0ABT2CA19_9ACTN|nr:ATP-grasp domain-containing protein [Streptomyces sp. LP05-1]MCS0634254.1 ATP-grasp domain-containing protein [Streptomyces sp. LP05-1]